MATIIALYHHAISQLTGVGCQRFPEALKGQTGAADVPVDADFVVDADVVYIH